MSQWTYATGYVKVSCFGRTQAEMEFILKTVLNHLPIVRGSEEPMYAHIIKAGGFNGYSTTDEFGQLTNITSVDSIYSGLETQDVYYIFVEGHFRDRSFKQTYRQIIKWLTRLAKRIWVEEIDIKISGGYEYKSKRIYVTGVGNAFENMFEDFSWENEGSYNWLENILPSYYNKD